MILGLGRSPEGRNGNSLQYPCLEDPTNRGAWQATVHGVVRVEHDLVPKLPPSSYYIFKIEKENTLFEKTER